MREFLKIHRWALFLALLAGIVSGLPTLFAPLAVGDLYQGIPYLPLNDEYHYLGSIQEILDGHWSASSVFLYEYKDLPTTMYPVNEWFYAIPAFVFGTVPVALASKFILPAVLFLLAYFFLYGVLRRSSGGAILTALAGALVVALGAEFVNYHYLLNLPMHGMPAVSLWTRLVNPIIGALQLFLFLIFIGKIWEREWRYAYIAASVTLSLMVGYFFTFGLALSILGILFLAALARKEYDIARQLFFAGVISAVLDAGWWHAMLTTLGGEEGRRIAMLSGMSSTHAPVLNKMLLVASAAFFGLFTYTWHVAKDRSNGCTWLFLGALLAASWLALNQQVITGRNVWHHHFVQYTVPLSAIVVLVAAHLALSRYRHLWKAALYALCAVIVGHGLYAVTAFREPHFLQYFTSLQRLAPVLAWLDTNAQKDCVVLGDPREDFAYKVEMYVPAFTHCNTYTVWDPALAKTSERQRSNFLLKMRLLGVEQENASAYLAENMPNIRGTFYTDWDQAFGDGVEPWMEELARELAVEYAAFAQVPLLEQIRMHKVDYLLMSSEISPALEKELPGLTLEFSRDGYYVYAFAPGTGSQNITSGS